MTKTDSEAINIGGKIEMKLIVPNRAKRSDRWYTSAFGLVLVNCTLIRYVSTFGVMTVVELYNLLI